MLTVVDLFAGVGGLSYGFSHDSAFSVVAANELLSSMAESYSINHPSTRVYCSDIKDFGIDVLHRDLGVSCGDIDLVVGGPPCQAYSTAGMRRDGDPRGTLFMEYFRVLQELRPRMFIFENVKGLLSMQGGMLVRHIISLFTSVGYHVSMRVLNAADYGTPQLRERVFLVGSLSSRPFEFPEPTHCDPRLGYGGLRSWVTLREALGDLPRMVSGESRIVYDSEPFTAYQRLMRAGCDVLREHETGRHNSRLIRIMEMLPDGGTPADLPEYLRPSSGFSNTYCRLWWDRPSVTLTRNFGAPSSARCIHPIDPRPLSIREGARLQGFPDDYVFCGSRADKHLQIGNAVPTFLSVALKGAVLDYLR